MEVKSGSFTSATATLVDAGTKKNIHYIFNGESLSLICKDFLLYIIQLHDYVYEHTYQCHIF